MHPFFDELRDPNTRLPNGRPLPPLFNFKPQGVYTVAVVEVNTEGCRTQRARIFTSWS